MRKAISTGLAPLLALASLGGCMTVTEDTWMMRSAETPVGWPEPTPIGEVCIKEYPVYRAATVAQGALADGMDSAFWVLFKHIKRNDIAMTAPVEMGMRVDGEGRAEMTSMAFLYGEPDLGVVGADQDVAVVDSESAVFASVGIRGSYRVERFADGLEIVESWLAEQEEWESAGSPRYLGYNSPMVPPPMRYGEVQVPVRRVEGWRRVDG